MNNYESQFFLKQVVGLSFNDQMVPLTCTIIGIHFYNHKHGIEVKYDLAVWIADHETSTRIYNINPVYIDAI